MVDDLWHNRDFVKLWAGETISLFGTQISLLALPLLALLQFHVGAAAVGWLRFCQLAPYILFGLFFGVWVDRRPRRPLMVAANCARMILLIIIPVLSFAGQLTFSVLPAMAFVIGTASVLFDVAWMSYVPHVVATSSQYVEANAKLGVSASSADVGGPGLAGWLIGLLSAPTALILDSLSYLLSLVSLLLIRQREEIAPVVTERRVMRELIDGVRWITDNRILRPLALVGFACNFSMIFVSSMFVVYAIDDNHFGAALVGTVLSAAGVGGLLGAVLSRRLLNRFRLGAVYASSLITIFVGPVLIPLAGGSTTTRAVLFSLSFFISYAGLGVAQVVVVSVRQASTPRSYMGRMNAGFRTVLFAGGALGGPAGGMLAGATDVRTALAWVSVASVLMVIPSVLSPVSRLVQLPSAPDAHARSLPA